MKKLMIAACVMAMVVVAHATTYNWSFSSGTDTIRNGWTAAEGGRVKSGSVAGAGLSAYLIAYTESTMTQDTILEGLRAGKTVTEIAGSAVLATSTTGSDSIITRKTWTDNVGNSITAFAVIINNDGDYVYINANSVLAAAADPQSADFLVAGATTRNNIDAAGTKSFGDEGWYSVAPEPTSGLLLLLGVASLALRRRRA